MHRPCCLDPEALLLLAFCHRTTNFGTTHDLPGGQGAIAYDPCIPVPGVLHNWPPSHNWQLAAAVAPSTLPYVPCGQGY